MPLEGETLDISSTGNARLQLASRGTTIPTAARRIEPASPTAIQNFAGRSVR
jgi:hypothetical protein